MASWYLPYEYTSVPIKTGNVNPFGIDPGQTTSILTGNVNPFDIDPEQTMVFIGVTGIVAADRLLESGSFRRLENGSLRTLEWSMASSSNADPFDIDPEQTTLITSGLTSSD